MARKKNNIVYSSDSGRMDQIRAQAKSAARPVVLPRDQQVAHLHREKQGRGGKWVVAVRNLKMTAADLKVIAKTLKKKCGVGGSAKDGEIIIQGDIRDRVSAELEKLGLKTKNIGG